MGAYKNRPGKSVWVKPGYVAPTPIGSAGNIGLIGSIGAYHPHPDHEPRGLPAAVQASLDAANAIVTELRKPQETSDDISGQTTH